MMENIQAKLGIPPTHQRVMFGGKLLETGKTVADSGIKKGGFLHLASCSSSFSTLHEQPAECCSWHSNIFAEPAGGIGSNEYRPEPRSGAIDVPLSTHVRLKISGDSHTGRICFRARKNALPELSVTREGVRVPGKVTMQTSEDEIELLWLPGVKLLPSTTYTVTLSGKSMSDMELCYSGVLYGSRHCGRMVNCDYQYTFTTVASDLISLKVLAGARMKRVSVRPGCIRTLREEVQRRVGCKGRFELHCRDAEVGDDEDTLELLDGDQILVEEPAD
jgi:hypothetical protein